MNYAIVQALALGASVTVVEGQQILEMGEVKHPFFSGIMESPIDGVDEALVVEKAFDILDRSFTWICDRKIDGADNTYCFPEMELTLKELVEPKEVGATFMSVSNESMGEWKTIVGPAYEFDSRDIDAFAALYKGKKSFLHMVAKVDGVAVGAGTLQRLGKIAVLHNITTCKQARGKGIGSRLVYELLKVGVQSGCTHSVIHGSKKAERLYQRLGYVTKKQIYANFFVKSSVE